MRIIVSSHIRAIWRWKKMLPKFNFFSDPAMIGPQWIRWLNSFELYANGKGLIVKLTKQQLQQRSRGKEQCYSIWLGLTYRKYLSLSPTLGTLKITPGQSMFSTRISYHRWTRRLPAKLSIRYLTKIRRALLKSRENCSGPKSDP